MKLESGLLKAVALLLVLAVHGTTYAQSTPQLNLLSMGDWGEAKSAQSTVAEAMANYVATQARPIDAMILAGDNFYVPLSGVDDEAWQSLFEQMYDPKKLNFPFYVSLGNHDYDNGKYKIELDYARLHPQSRWKFPARWYRIDLPANQPLATILMLDSNQPTLSPAEWADQIAWLDHELANRRNAPWVICCAHHPLFSNGVAADNGVLQRDWGTLFQKYHVDFYLCGHEHNLQHLEIPGWSSSFVLAGGGGAHSHPMLRNNRGPFSRSVYGFAHFELTPAIATVRYIGADGKPVHIFQRTKVGQSTVLLNTKSDSPVDKPLEAIMGIYGRMRGQTQPSTHQLAPPSTLPSTRGSFPAPIEP